MKSARFSGGTAVSSTKAIGRLSPFMLPSSPTAFLRMSQMRSTAAPPRASVKPRRPRFVPSAASASVTRRSGASTASSLSPTNSTRLTPAAGLPSSSGKKARTPSQIRSSWASASTLESTVSMEAAPNRISDCASRKAASKLP